MKENGKLNHAVVRLVRAASLLLCLAILVGCAQPAPAPATQQPGQPTAVPQKSAEPTTVPQKLTIAQGSFSGETFYPPLDTMTAFIGMGGRLFDFLLIYDAGELKPGIAEKWELAQDQLSWTFNIRKGVKFHNGDDLTGKDVKWSLERHLDKEVTLHPVIKSMIDRVELVDDLTVRVLTKGKQPLFPYAVSNLTTASGAVMPKDYIEKNGVAYFNQHPVGSGSYKFVKRTPGDSTEWEAVDNHWLRTPGFKYLEIVLMPEEATRVAALKTGQVDMIELDLQAARDLRQAGYDVRDLGDVVTTIVGLYGAYHPDAVKAKMPITDVRVRKALSLAINRDTIRENFFYGMAAPPPPPFLTSSAEGIDIGSWMNQAKQYYRYDPEEAKKLLADAGYPNGFTIKLYSSVWSFAAYLPKLAEIVASDWQKIGVKVEIVPIDFGSFAPMRKGPAPALVGQAAMLRYIRGLPARSLYSAFHSTGSFAMVGNSMPQLDKILQDALQETDPAKNRIAIDNALKIAFDSYTTLMISENPRMAAIGPRVDYEIPKGAQFLAEFIDRAKPKARK